MKNHVKVNGKLIQTNKRWSQLKQKQQEYISGRLREAYLSFAEQHQRAPKKEDHETIIDQVMEKVEEREIWIPRNEVRMYYRRRIIRWRKLIENDKKGIVDQG